MRPPFTIALLLTTAVLTSCAGTGLGGSAGDPGAMSPTATPTAATSVPASEAPVEHDEFAVTVTTEQEAYADGETVTFRVEVCNRGPATTTEGGGGSDIPIWFQILDGQGEVVADDSHAVRTLEIKFVRWSEGQCRTAQASWDQHYWNRAEDRPSEPPEIYGTPQRGDLVPPGDYRIRVTTPQGTATSAPFELQQRD